MNSETIILSSAGLRNLTIERSNETENEFCFYFGNQVLKMHRVFADFLSPKVSHLHNCDPTSKEIYFDESILEETQTTFQDLLTEETAFALQQIAHGYSINVNKENNYKLKIISLILDNEELFQKLSATNKEVDHASIDEIIKELLIYSSLSQSFDEDLFQNLISQLSKQFSSITIPQLKSLPKSILYLIIKNEQFQHDNDDQLIAIIRELFSEENSADNDLLSQIYDEIDLFKLSPQKLHDFVHNIPFSEVTCTFWSKFLHYFFFISDLNSNNHISNQSIQCPFDGSNRLNGIINYLTLNSGKDIHSIVTATNSGESQLAKYALELNNDSIFQSGLYSSYKQWLKYDFGKLQIRPTHYSIRTRTDKCDLANPQHWCIEVSNDDQNWTIIDSRENVTSLQKANQLDTFEIKNEIPTKESYRYIRLRQTGKSTGNCEYLTLTAFEIFGDLIINESDQK